MINIFRKEWFLFAMVAAIGLAALMPDLGKSGGWLHLDAVTGIGIALIFFLHGIGLSAQKIRQGLSNWRLHILIQVTTFVIYPLIWVIAGHGMLALLPSALAIGFCYLFALPSTISSSVAMTSIGKGNVPGAIFNASLSSILGIVLTPLLVGLFTDVQGAQMELTATIVSVAKLLLLPMCLGQLSRALLAPLVERHKGLTNKVDKWVIIMIVLNAFSDSVIERIWGGFSFMLLLSCAAICLVVLLAISYLLQFSAKKLGFSHEDEVAAVFCGTKKKLAAGIPMAKVIFGANPNLGMILLPIMLYHPIQLFYCAMLANRYAQRVATPVPVK